MFIAVRLDNYIIRTNTNIIVLHSAITRASISSCSLYILDNTLMGKTLVEKRFGTGISLKRQLTIIQEKLFGRNQGRNKYS